MINDNLGFAVLPGILLKDRPFAIACVLCFQNAVMEILGSSLPPKMILVDGWMTVWSVGEVFIEEGLSSDRGILLTGTEEGDDVDSIKICWPLKSRHNSIAAGWLNLDGDYCGWRRVGIWVVCQFNDRCAHIDARARFFATFWGQWRALIRGPPLPDRLWWSRRAVTRWKLNDIFLPSVQRRGWWLEEGWRESLFAELALWTRWLVIVTITILWWQCASDGLPILWGLCVALIPLTKLTMFFWKLISEMRHGFRL